ncbi:MAG: hypothetical protein H0W86_08070 [Armatimonadetes bacterium]|nr:hypothetical protein [Armatimonadota bacterium]
MDIVRAAVGICILSSAGCGVITTTRVSVTTGGGQSNGHSEYSAISADGRFVVFQTKATNLAPADSSDFFDVYRHDRQTNTTVRASLTANGSPPTAHCTSAAISGDGRFVAFHSPANNLVLGDINGEDDVFVRDVQNGTTEIVSVSSAETRGNGASYFPAIDGAGRFVTFTSLASNLVTGDSNEVHDVFVRDRQLGTTTLVSTSTAGIQANFHSAFSDISADGRFVAFVSGANNLFTPDTNFAYDIFVKDRTSGKTTCMSLNQSGAQGNGDCRECAINDNGQVVVFECEATDMVPGDTNGLPDIIVRDATAGSTTRVNTFGGVEANGFSNDVDISGSGRYVVFSSSATNLVSRDENNRGDVFLHDRNSGRNFIASVKNGGVQELELTGGVRPNISRDGVFVVFWSDFTGLVPNDTNGVRDIFVNTRSGLNQ